MTSQINSRLSSCLGSPNKKCVRQAAEIGSTTFDIFVDCVGKAADPAEVVNRVAALCLAVGDLRCPVLRGLPCPYAPPRPRYDVRHLKLFVGDREVAEFHRHSRQTELLEVFQAADWPESIDDPLGPPSPLDLENGLNDILYELNGRQRLGPQIHFWYDRRAVYWKIVNIVSRDGKTRKTPSSH